MRWSLLVLLLPLLGSCSCDDTVADATGEVLATPASLDFGGVHLGESATLQVEFRNEGRTPVSLSADMPAAFRVEPATLDLGPGISGSWTFVFSPELIGPVDGEASLAVMGATNKSIQIALAGEGLSRDVSIADLDFGLVPVGESRTLPFPVQSESAGPLSVQVAITGSDAGSFRLEEGALELLPGASGQAEITFSPQIRGRRAVQLEVRTCDGCAVQRVTARGVGAVSDLAVHPRILDFGKVGPGSSKVLEVELSNRGDLPIHLGSAALVGAGLSSFSADTSVFPRELAAGEDVVLSVTFAPDREASFEEETDALHFFGEDPNLPMVELPMRGTPGGPHIVVTPEDIDFGHQPVGLPVTATITVRNIGEPASVRVLSVGIEGEQMGSFQVHPIQDMPADVGSDTFSAEIIYRAPAAGISNANLRITTDDDENPVMRVPLGGSARTTQPCDVTVVPPLLRFGLVPDSGEFLRSVTVTNKGVDDCMIWDVKLEGGSPLFATAGTPEGTTVIPPGGSLPLSVRFTPNRVSEVLQENALSFAHSAPDVPRRVVGISAFPSRLRVEASPNPVEIGAWPIDYRSIKNLTVANRGVLDFNVSGASRTADTTTEFDVTAAAGVPGRLSSDGSGVFLVSYAASDAGADEGQLEIWVAEAPEPLLVDVLGAGTDEECGVLCAAPSAFCPGPQTTNVNNVIQLVGAGSDPANDPLNCTWSVLSRPTGSSAAPQSPAQCVTDFIPDIVGDYTMQLTVRDPMGNTGSCTTVVHANPYGGLWVEMFWSPAGDIDLHVLHPNAGSPSNKSSWTSPQWACHYFNCDVTNSTPLEWDTANLNDNPSLDVDDRSGTGPENIRVHQPSSSHPYSVGFKNWDNGNFPVAVTYNVYCGGQQVHGQTYQSTMDDEIIYVGDVTYNATSGCTFVPSGLVLPP